MVDAARLDGWLRNVWRRLRNRRACGGRHLARRQSVTKRKQQLAA